jgi:hypothetical protein
MILLFLLTGIVDDATDIVDPFVVMLLAVRLLIDREGCLQRLIARATFKAVVVAAGGECAVSRIET